MLHILNGDATRMKLERSGVPGEIAVWGDVLYDGPVPVGTSDAEFSGVRARFHSGDFLSAEDASAMHRRWDEGLDRATRSDEAVLWFEHDLHDQLLLVRQLDWFARRAPTTTLSLICIGEFPGVEPFHGLGQLSPEQLASLLPTRRVVKDSQFALAQRAWKAFTGSYPLVIERVAAGDCSPLPFLASALHRLLEDFPDRQNGLPRTERTILEVLAAQGPLPFKELFPLQQQTEERAFMGDWTFWSRLTDMARGARPLVSLDPPGTSADIDRTHVAITDDGRRVLAGELDWMQIGEFDRWMGGTHFHAPGGGWRWDAAAHGLALKE